MGISLPSMMMELAAEWILLSLPLLRHVRAGSPVGMGFGPISATTVEGIPCGWCKWNCWGRTTIVGLRLREPTTRVGIPDWTGLCKDPSGKLYDRDISNGGGQPQVGLGLG